MDLKKPPIERSDTTLSKSGDTSDHYTGTGTNIFQSSDFAQSEDLVLIVEKSRELSSTDISPNRLLKFTELMGKFVEERLKIDYRDRYYACFFNNEVSCPMNSFDNFSQNLISQINKDINIAESIELIDTNKWAQNFLIAFQKGIQKLISSFKEIRNKTLRMIVFLNQLPMLPKSFAEQLEQIVERTAQRLDIIIDVVLIVGLKPLKIFDYENPLKKISNLTGGKYYQIARSSDLEQAFKEITKKKEVLLKHYLGERDYSQEKQFIEVIASDLEKITEVLDDAQLKCQICFKKECTCKNLSDYYQHLGICPNCKKVLHMCCSGKWAEQQNVKSNFIGFPNVFRCPYCFYLLKVPREFVNFDAILYQLQERWLKQQKTEEADRKAKETQEKELRSFVDEAEQNQSDKDKIIKWLTEKLPNKSPREINKIAEDVVAIQNREEKLSFIDYLKFKEKIEDDSLPI